MFQRNNAIVNWKILHHRNFEVSELTEALQKACTLQGITINVPQMRRFDEVRELETCLKDSADEGITMILIILPNKLRDFYKKIK